MSFPLTQGFYLSTSGFSNSLCDNCINRKEECRKLDSPLGGTWSVGPILW